MASASQTHIAVEIDVLRPGSVVVDHRGLPFVGPLGQF